MPLRVTRGDSGQTCAEKCEIRMSLSQRTAAVTRTSSECSHESDSDENDLDRTMTSGKFLKMDENRKAIPSVEKSDKKRNSIKGKRLERGVAKESEDGAGGSKRAEDSGKGAEPSSSDDDGAFMESEEDPGSRGDRPGSTGIESMKRLQAAREEAGVSNVNRENARNERPYVVFMAGETDGDMVEGAFKNVNGLLIKIMKDVREKIPDAWPSISESGNELKISVKTEEEREQAMKWVNVAGICVRCVRSNNPSHVALWGRIERVHSQLTEDDIMSELKNQGVGRVRRVQRPRRMENGNGDVVTTMVNTATVDIMFQTGIRESVNIIGELFRVTLLAPEPKQCLKCLTYGHYKSECQQREVCRRCGKEGHMMNACTERMPKCVNCGGEHVSTYKGCRVYQEIAEIKQRAYERRVRLSIGAVVETRKSRPKEVKPTPEEKKRDENCESGEGGTVAKKVLYTQVVKRNLVKKGADGDSKVVCSLTPRVMTKVSSSDKKEEQTNQRNSKSIMVIVKRILQQMATKHTELEFVLELISLIDDGTSK